MCVIISLPHHLKIYIRNSLFSWIGRFLIQTLMSEGGHEVAKSPTARFSSASIFQVVAETTSNPFAAAHCCLLSLFPCQRDTASN